MLKLSWNHILAACLTWLSLTHFASAEELLPGILYVTPIPGAHVVDDCGPIILPGQEHDTKIACVYFLDEHGDERMGMNGPSAQTPHSMARRDESLGLAVCASRRLRILFRTPQSWN